MLKLGFYLILTVIGIVGALMNPVAGAIASVGFYMMNPSALAMETGGLRFQQYVTVAFLMGVLLYPARPLPAKGGEGRIVILLWIFIALAMISGLVATFSSANAFAALFELAKTVLVSTLLVRAIRTEKHLHLLVLALVLGVLHAATMHVLGPRLGFVPLHLSREYGVLPDQQTSVMLLFVPLLVVLAGSASKWTRVLAFCTLPLAIDSIVNTFQRTGFVSLAVEMLLIFVLAPRKLTKKIVPVALVGIALFVFRFTPDDYWEWMSTISAPTEEASANSRLIVNGASIRMFLDHPLGVGYRNYPDVSPRYLPRTILSNGRRAAHNVYFNILCETGIQGFIIWISAVIGTLVLLRRLRKQDAKFGDMSFAPYALGFEIGLYGWLVDGCFQGDQEADPAYWFMALAVVMTRLYYVRQKERAAAPATTAREVCHPWQTRPAALPAGNTVRRTASLGR